MFKVNIYTFDSTQRIHILVVLIKWDVGDVPLFNFFQIDHWSITEHKHTKPHKHWPVELLREKVYLRIGGLLFLTRHPAREITQQQTSKMAARMLMLREFHSATLTEEDCRGWLRRNGLLAVNITCPRCNSIMEERQYSRVSHGVIWRCPPKQCRATVSVSVRKDSFFEKSHLPLTKLCDLLYYWSIDVSVAETQFQV